MARHRHVGRLLTTGGWLEPLAHVESAATKRRLYGLLAVCGLLDELVTVRAREANTDELTALHTADYADR